jgi:hypothetical protein
MDAIKKSVVKAVLDRADAQFCRATKKFKNDGLKDKAETQHLCRPTLKKSRVAFCNAISGSIPTVFAQKLPLDL